MNCKNVEEFIKKTREIRNKIYAEEVRYNNASIEYQMANESDHESKMIQLRREYDSVHYIRK